MIRLKSILLTDGPGGDGDIRYLHKKNQSCLQLLKDLLRDHRPSGDLPGHRPRLLRSYFIEERSAILLLFNDGTLAWLFVNTPSYTLDSLYLDTFLTTKIPPQASDVVYREGHGVFFTYPHGKIIAVLFDSPLKSTRNSQRLSRKLDSLNPNKSFKLKHKGSVKIVEMQIHLHAQRRVDRKLCLSEGERQLLAVYCKPLSNSTLSPWSAPCKPDANLFVYSFQDGKLDLLSYASTQSPIIKVSFSKTRKSQVLVLTEGSAVSEISLDFIVYLMACEDDTRECATGRGEEMFKDLSIHIPLMTPVISAEFNDAQDKIVILCQDRKVLMFNLSENAVYPLETSIEGTHLMCSSLDGFFVICDQHGQLLAYDYALSVIPGNYDDLRYMDLMESLQDVSMISDNAILLTYQSVSPSAEGVQNELALVSLPLGLDVVSLIQEYLKHDYMNEAMANLSILNWNFDPFLAYNSLNVVFNFLLKCPLNPLRETQIEGALGHFFRSKYPISLSIEKEYKESMHCLAKRFFNHLIRYKSLKKAFLLAVDLKSKELFQLLQRIARENGEVQLDEVCAEKIDHLTRREEKRRPKTATSIQKSSTITDSFPLPSKSGETSSQLQDVVDVAPTRRRPLPAPRKTAPSPPLPPGQDLFTTNQSRSPTAEKTTMTTVPKNAFNVPSPPTFLPEVLAPKLPSKNSPKAIIDSPVIPPKLGPQSNPSMGVVSKERPPPIPPKTFFNNNYGTHPHPGVQFVSPEVPLPPQPMRTIKSAINRQTQSMINNQSNPSIMSTSSRDEEKRKKERQPVKPTIECIHFGVV